MPYGYVAAAAISAYGAKSSADKNAKAAGKNSDPWYLEDAKHTALDKAKAISDKTYTPYTGQRVASLTDNERTASALARTGSADARGYLTKAGNAVDSSLEDFSGDNVKKYMNPYLESVLTPQIREQNAQYERDKASLLNSKAGAWGGDRVAFQSSQLEKNHMNSVSDITGKTYASAYDNARQTFFADKDRQQRAAQAYQSVAGDITKLNTQQIQDLMATGGTERLLSQANLDFNYQQFTENRDWDTHNLQPLLDSIAAAKGGVMKDSTAPNAWGQALGAASTVAGMYFTGGGGGKTMSSSEQRQVGGGGYANSALEDAGFGSGWKTPAISAGG